MTEAFVFMNTALGFPRKLHAETRLGRATCAGARMHSPHASPAPPTGHSAQTVFAENREQFQHSKRGQLKYRRKARAILSSSRLHHRRRLIQSRLLPSTNTYQFTFRTCIKQMRAFSLHESQPPQPGTRGNDRPYQRPLPQRTTKTVQRRCRLPAVADATQASASSTRV